MRRYAKVLFYTIFVTMLCGCANSPDHDVSSAPSPSLMTITHNVPAIFSGEAGKDTIRLAVVLETPSEDGGDQKPYEDPHNQTSKGGYNATPENARNKRIRYERKVFTTHQTTRYIV